MWVDQNLSDEFVSDSNHRRQDGPSLCFPLYERTKIQISFCSDDLTRHTLNLKDSFYLYFDLIILFLNLTLHSLQSIILYSLDILKYNFKNVPLSRDVKASDLTAVYYFGYLYISILF